MSDDAATDPSLANDIQNYVESVSSAAETLAGGFSEDERKLITAGLFLYEQQAAFTVLQIPLSPDVNPYKIILLGLHPMLRAAASAERKSIVFATTQTAMDGKAEGAQFELRHLHRLEFARWGDLMLMPKILKDVIILGDLDFSNNPRDGQVLTSRRGAVQPDDVRRFVYSLTTNQTTKTLAFHRIGWPCPFAFTYDPSAPAPSVPNPLPKNENPKGFLAKLFGSKE